MRHPCKDLVKDIWLGVDHRINSHAVATTHVNVTASPNQPIAALMVCQ